jgi:hypothetical protein
MGEEGGCPSLMMSQSRLPFRSEFLAYFRSRDSREFSKLQLPSDT